MGGLTKQQIKDTKVLVVGGGYGGTGAGQTLKKDGIPFVLVEPKQFFYHNLAALRAAVYPQFTDVTTVSLKTTFGSSFKQAAVSDIDLENKTATLDDGSTVKYSHLILATGNAGVYPSLTDLKTHDEIKGMNQKVSRDIDKADSVVIIGGGVTGCELAGEIWDKHPKKKITIINSGSTVMSNITVTNGDKVKKRIAKLLKDRKVDIRTGEKVSNLDFLEFNKLGKHLVETNKGSYDADIVFKAIGMRPNTDLLRKVLGDDKIDSSNRVKITPEVFVEGHSDVYCVGDCANWKQEKMAAHAQNQGETAAKNIKRQLQGKKMKVYKPRFDGMAVPIGQKNGAGVAYGHSMPLWLVKHLKSKDLTSNQFWEYMDQKMPKVKLN